jgi:ABC-type antimicrobial peptide transport system permease subunit
MTRCHRRFPRGDSRWKWLRLFALTALLLAGLGIYGTISYVVSERTHEIGIRLALGAQRGEILGWFCARDWAWRFSGAAVGLVSALIASRLMAGLLYGVRPTDPLTFAGVTLVLTVWRWRPATFPRGGRCASGST